MSLRGKWIVALLVVALAIAGCGSGGGDPSESTSVGTESTPAAAKETTTALSKTKLIEQGDAICAKVNTTVGAINPESPNATARVAGLYGGMVKSLEKLGKPQEAEADYSQYLKASSALATALNELKLASERESSNLKAEEKTAEGALSTFLLKAGKYGFEECSQGPSSPSASTAPSGEGGQGEPGGAESGTAVPEAEIELVPKTGGTEGG